MNSRAWCLIRDASGQTHAELARWDETAAHAQLPDGDVLIHIEYSSLNFKDALAFTQRAPVVRRWPMVPGIDLAGRIVTSKHLHWRPGQTVVVTGWGLGESYWGGLAQHAWVKSDWLCAVPATFSSQDAMRIGTAGFTAMLACLAIREGGIATDAGSILVTGATGGVGSIAIAILSRWGYRVTALTGKADSADFLHALGAHEILPRADWITLGKPLQSERWAGVVDTLGGAALANACAQTQRHGVVAACGLALDSHLPLTVMPFILRGLRLQGIDSVYCSAPLRAHAWQLLAETLPSSLLAQLSTTIGLDDCLDAAERLMRGQMQGRYVVDVHLTSTTGNSASG